MSRREPLFHLRFIHQLFRGVAFADVPVVLCSESPGHQILDGVKLVLRQDAEAVLDDVAETVVEGKHDLVRRLDREEIVERAVGISSLTQSPELPVEVFGADVEKRVAAARGNWSDFVIGEDRRATAHETPLGRAEKNAR